MTGRGLRILLTTLCCLLALATSASAVTDPAEGYKTKEECTRAQEVREKREETRRKQDPSTERYFSCLPDTADPRGPKNGEPWWDRTTDPLIKSQVLCQLS